MLRLFFVPETTSALDVPAPLDGGPEHLQHYVRSFYVFAGDPAEVVQFIRADEASDGATILSVAAPLERALTDVPPDIAATFPPIDGPGVYWKSGRAFFPWGSDTG